jgi:glycosyltransferase involved in cell wall biosynthesis
MKILQIPDSPWSIGQLCDGIRKYNPHIEFTLIYVPPRDIDEHIDEIKQALKTTDLVDFQYWNVARQLIERIPELKNVPKILTHHNEKNLLSFDQSCFEKIIVKTKKSFKIIEEKYPGKAVLIPNVTDLEEFQFNEDYKPKEMSLGYVGRICRWKGMKEIARIAYELNLPLKFMGRMDKMDYWEEIPEEHRIRIDYTWFNCNDEDRKDFYKNIDFYIGNSSDNHEAGTLGFLEAMSSGIPVITTPSGLAADIIEDCENGVLVKFDDYEDLKQKIIQTIAAGQKFWDKIRNKAWETVRNFNYIRYAWDYAKLYNAVIYRNQILVSIIIPATYSRFDSVQEIIKQLDASDYENIEAIVIWDELIEDEIIKQLISKRITLKQLFTNREGYNLAMARNLGVIEAQGEILIFNDSRIRPELNAISVFVNKFIKIDNSNDVVLDNKNKTWYFGDKGGQKINFVENFSAIRREILINAGMFNERINRYGGMSQELRSRFRKQGIELQYLPEAKSTQMLSSKMTNKRRSDIVKMKDLLYKLGI